MPALGRAMGDPYPSIGVPGVDYHQPDRYRDLVVDIAAGSDPFPARAHDPDGPEDQATTTCLVGKTAVTDRPDTGREAASAWW